MTTRGGLTQDGTLLVAWVLRICLQELAEDGDDFAEQMLDLGHPIDLLRAEAAALPKESRPGLIVQPYVWALAVAMLDIESRRREGRSDRCGGTCCCRFIPSPQVYVEDDRRAPYRNVNTCSCHERATSYGVYPSRADKPSCYCASCCPISGG